MNGIVEGSKTISHWAADHHQEQEKQVERIIGLKIELEQQVERIELELNRNN